MPKSVNKVILLGNVGKDPEIKHVSSGMAIANFSIATSSRFKDKSDEWQEKAEWHNLVAFQRTAEIVGEYVKKGSKVYVEGRLQTSSWDDKESGQKRYKTEIVVNDLVLLGGGKRDDSDEQDQRSHEDRKPARSTAPSDDSEIDDSSIPF